MNLDGLGYVFGFALLGFVALVVVAVYGLLYLASHLAWLS